MSKLSYGLNITKKPPSLATRPPPAKRKTIFDDDSGPEDGPDDEDNAESIDTIGGVTTATSSMSKPKIGTPTNRPSKPSQISQYGDLSTHHSVSRHVKTAQTLDSSVYDYDSVYDSLHARPASSSTSAEADKRPRYMTNLLAAAETRKRDQLRAKEKMLAKEREAEGDEFADKEKFVTAAYKRQQEEMRRLEEEEAVREREAEERKKREGGGLKGLYKSMLEKDEQKHAAVIKAVEQARTKPHQTASANEEEKKKPIPEETETDLARKKGAIINEDGQIVDKRQLLTAGLNATSAPRPAPRANRASSSSHSNVPASEHARPSHKPPPPPPPPPPHSSKPRNSGVNAHGSARERETSMFEEQILGKRPFSHRDENGDGDDEEAREVKSRRIEDEILGRGK